MIPVDVILDQVRWWKTHGVKPGSALAAMKVRRRDDPTLAVSWGEVITHMERFYLAQANASLAWANAIQDELELARTIEKEMYHGRKK